MTDDTYSNGRLIGEIHCQIKETIKACENLRIGVAYEEDKDSFQNFPNKEYLLTERIVNEKSEEKTQQLNRSQNYFLNTKETIILRL
jgi:hypothetical protein